MSSRERLVYLCWVCLSSTEKAPWFLCSVFIAEPGVTLLSMHLRSRLLRSSPGSLESCLTRLPSSSLVSICSFFPKAQNLFHLLLELKQNHWLELGPSIALEWLSVCHCFLVHHSHTSCTCHRDQDMHLAVRWHSSYLTVSPYLPFFLTWLTLTELGLTQAFGVWLGLLPS